MDSLGNCGEFGCIDADTDCAVMETFDVDLAKSGDTHKVITDIGYCEFLQIVDLEGFADNLRRRQPDFSTQQCLDAVLYYYRQDACIQASC